MLTAARKDRARYDNETNIAQLPSTIWRQMRFSGNDAMPLVCWNHDVFRLTVELTWAALFHATHRHCDDELRKADAPPLHLRPLFACCNLQYLRTPDHGRLLKPSPLLIGADESRTAHALPLRASSLIAAPVAIRATASFASARTTGLPVTSSTTR